MNILIALVVCSEVLEVLATICLLGNVKCAIRYCHKVFVQKMIRSVNFFVAPVINIMTVFYYVMLYPLQVFFFFQFSLQAAFGIQKSCPLVSDESFAFRMWFCSSFVLFCLFVINFNSCSICISFISFDLNMLQSSCAVLYQYLL